MRLFDGMSIEGMIAVIGVCVSGIVWLIRLEGVVKADRRETDILRSDIEDLRHRHEALDSKVVEKLSIIEKTLARIEGYLFDKDRG
jgi:hypothetical protein